jgi:hypothetical protein
MVVLQSFYDAIYTIFTFNILIGNPTIFVIYYMQKSNTYYSFEFQITVIIIEIRLPVLLDSG